MAESSGHCYRCVQCGASYRHSNGLARHYLSVHQLIWRNNSFLSCEAEELAHRTDALRRSQMSSRRRRRRDRAAAVEPQPMRVAQLRAVESMDMEDWDELFDSSGLPELAPVYASCTDSASQTDAVNITDAPPVTYDGETQTEKPVSMEASTETVVQRPIWPASINFRSMIQFVYNHPHLSLDAMLRVLTLDQPDLSEEEMLLVRATMCGVVGGFDFQARHIVRTVNHIMEDLDEGPEHIARLQGELNEQSQRRF